MAKKRKAEEHTPTLRDFFGASSSAKRRKSTSGTQVPVRKPAKARPAEDEIIEITDSEEEGPLRTAIEVRPESQPSKGFGKPLDFLLHGGPQRQDTSRGLEETQESKYIVITPDSATPLEPLPFQHGDSSFSEGDSEGSEIYTKYLASGGDDEWGRGDDERTTRIDLDEEDEPEEEPDDEGKVLLPPESQEDGNQEGYSCPLCGRDLSAFDEQDMSLHVNKCIDTMSLPTSNSKPRNVPSKSPSKTFRPLSSYPVPNRSNFTSTPVILVNAPAPSKCLDAFSFLMSRNKEYEAWKEATEAESSKLTSNSKSSIKGKSKNGPKGKVNEKPGVTNGRRHAPFYKVMQGMPIAVDAFRYGKIPGVTAYLLTHAHSDHYTNLSSSWKNGHIYCSKVTANLIIHMLGVDEEWVHPLRMNSTTVLPDTGGVEVTLIEANHCPGSCLFLFSGKQTINAGDSSFHSPFVGTDRMFRYLHCGDFRACPEHVLHPAVMSKKLDLIYLDTTYLDPKYCFPPQRLVIDACAELARRIAHEGGNDRLDQKSRLEQKASFGSWMNGNPKGKAKVEVAEGQQDTNTSRVLVVIGTYSIGKERVVKAVAQALNSRIYCETRKRKLFECQEDESLMELLDEDPNNCNVHVMPLQTITSDRLLEYLETWKGRWDKVLGLRPTGWTYTPPAGTDTSNLQNIINRDQKRVYNWASLRPMRNSSPSVMLYGVPYSEHSSFFELTCFALSMKYVRVIATVNVGSAKSRAKMDGCIERWEIERRRRDRENADSHGVVAFRDKEYW